MQEQLGIPACFSSSEKLTDDPTAITKSGQNVFVSVYRTKIADHCRSITVTWCKNLLLHGLSVSVEGSDRESQYTCKVELKPWYFWKKHGSKRFLVDDAKPVDVYWDLRLAKFKCEAEPTSDYYVAVVSDGEVVLLLGNMKNEAYRKTGCRPALIDPILISRKEHVFGKRKFSTRVKFHDKGGLHEISIECNSLGGDDPEMEIRIDGHLVVHVKHLQWKFRGNESIRLSKGRIEVYYDVHDWLFSPGLRHALFIFKPTLLTSSGSISSSPSTGSSSSVDGCSALGSPDFCLFLYAWKVE
ncbi:hypothetical protein PHJA_002713000 [Phtheirospermum japonicum]|uniref:Uncharacterized protein n=1 Tax=Phtheirospermum japonicum TaxID=374723 RepID=A0A830D797_9LAMI|nr:hypothetical protein PHJA_002713000 [Phtheirospermum japonicum]